MKSKSRIFAAVDALLILKYYTGEITQFPAEG